MLPRVPRPSLTKIIILTTLSFSFLPFDTYAQVAENAPSSAAHGFGVANGKTLFPSSWTPETVIDFARTDGRTIRIGEKGFKKEVIYEGVTVTVNFGKDGRPNSAFPSWNQGGN